jgi:hypothetical protein
MTRTRVISNPANGGHMMILVGFCVLLVACICATLYWIWRELDTYLYELHETEGAMNNRSKEELINQLLGNLQQEHGQLPEPVAPQRHLIQWEEERRGLRSWFDPTRRLEQAHQLECRKIELATIRRLLEIKAQEVITKGEIFRDTAVRVYQRRAEHFEANEALKAECLAIVARGADFEEVIEILAARGLTPAVQAWAAELVHARYFTGNGGK